MIIMESFVSKHFMDRVVVETDIFAESFLDYIGLKLERISTRPRCINYEFEDSRMLSKVMKTAINYVMEQNRGQRIQYLQNLSSSGINFSPEALYDKALFKMKFIMKQKSLPVLLKQIILIASEGLILDKFIKGASTTVEHLIAQCLICLYGYFHENFWRHMECAAVTICIPTPPAQF